MSLASIKGRSFEMSVAKAIRRKLGIAAYRDSKSGAGWFRGDIRIPTLDFQLEAKSQKTWKIREWFSQAVAATPVHKQPLLVVDNDSQPLAILLLDDLLDLLRTIDDDTTTIKGLRK